MAGQQNSSEFSISGKHASSIVLSCLVYTAISDNLFALLVLTKDSRQSPAHTLHADFANIVRIVYANRLQTAQGSGCLQLFLYGRLFLLSEMQTAAHDSCHHWLYISHRRFAIDASGIIHTHAEE